MLFTGSGDVEPIRGDIALQLADAVRRSLRVRMRYTAYDGTTSTRRLSAYGLVRALPHDLRQRISILYHIYSTPSLRCPEHITSRRLSICRSSSRGIACLTLWAS